MTLKKRTLVRIISYVVAIILVLAIRNCQLMSRNTATSNALNQTYQRAVEDLSACADSITNTLSKEIYCGTPEMLQKLSIKLWNESNNAKIALSQLPVEEVSLENTYKFLSQVGNYALSISKKTDNGELLTNDEYENLNKLYELSKEFSDSMWTLENNQSYLKSGDFMDISQVELSDGFKEMEEGFEDFPSLIYDGPFSDHILEKEPEMLKNQDEVTEKYALERASKVAQINQSQLEPTEGEQGKMPSYVFEGDGVTVAITKNGGFVSYMLKSRSVKSTSISVNKAQNNAVDYLLTLGIENMKVTYYECYNNVMTINFASKQDDILCYTDLIKVSVALDNGEIIGFDARGYIVNHYLRKFPEITVSEKNAQAKLSPLLTVKKTQLALIPTDSKGEVLCHEFLCTSTDNNEILVYIGVESGIEEDILILFKSENGVLTI